MECVINIKYRKLNSLEELNNDQLNLLNAAKDAAQNRAYAPYSNFSVGAAVMFDDGEIISASNQESEVYPSGICAERALLYFVQSNKADKIIKKILIVSTSSINECYPCGGCRQVILDTEKRQVEPIEIIMCGATSATIVDSAKEIMPFNFTLIK